MRRNVAEALVGPGQKQFRGVTRSLNDWIVMTPKVLRLSSRSNLIIVALDRARTSGRPSLAKDSGAYRSITRVPECVSVLGGPKRQASSFASPRNPVNLAVGFLQHVFRLTVAPHDAVMQEIGVFISDVTPLDAMKGDINCDITLCRLGDCEGLDPRICPAALIDAPVRQRCPRARARPAGYRKLPVRHR